MSINWSIGPSVGKAKLIRQGGGKRGKEKSPFPTSEGPPHLYEMHPSQLVACMWKGRHREVEIGLKNMGLKTWGVFYI